MQSPDGQHSSVVFAARGTHVEVVGQQKSEGKPVPLHEVYVGSGQVDARPKISYEDRAVEVEASAMSTKCLAIRDFLIPSGMCG